MNTGVLSDFRVQPMLSCFTHEVAALELLYRKKIDFSDKEQMLLVDLQALKAANMLSTIYGPSVRVHCNVEISSMFRLEWIDEMSEQIKPGVVVEIVERNDLAREPRSLRQIVGLCEWVRGHGGEIAIDDVAGSELEGMMIEAIRPEILKANTRQGLGFIANIGKPSIVVAEHIENMDVAVEAMLLGASELQGYWCDVLKEHEMPPGMTPPGVAYRNAQRPAEAH